MSVRVALGETDVCAPVLAGLLAVVWGLSLKGGVVMWCQSLAWPASGGPPRPRPCSRLSSPLSVEEGSLAPPEEATMKVVANCWPPCRVCVGSMSLLLGAVWLWTRAELDVSWALVCCGICVDWPETLPPASGVNNKTVPSTVVR